MTPIKIQANDPETFKIIWQITTACTYSCEYCPKELHTGTNEIIDLEDFAGFLDLFKDRKIVMTITGGEPTIHPQFMDIARLLKSKGVKTVVDSNLSRTSRFYEEAAGLVDNWCVTLHPSQHTLDLDKIRTLAYNSFTVVYVMMDPKHWSLAMSWWEELKSVENIKLTVLKPVDNWAGADYQGKFTEQQQKFLNEVKATMLFTDQRLEELKDSYSWLQDLGSTVVWEDGSSEDLDADALMRQGSNRFQGWHCLAGKEVIAMNHQGRVSLATCGVARVDHWSQLTLNDITEPVVCPRTVCGCGTDIKGTKYKL